MTFSKNFTLQLRLYPGKDKGYAQSIFALQRAPKIKTVQRTVKRPKSFLSRGRRNIFQTLNDNELMKRYRLDGAGILFVVDLIRYVLSHLTQ